MELKIWLVALLTVIGLYMEIKHTNAYDKVEEDKYFSKQYRLSDRFFYHFTKQKYLRFKEYWQWRITLIHFTIYTLILLNSRLITTMLNIEYSIEYKKFLMIYYFILGLSPALIDIIVRILIKIKYLKKDN